MTPKLCTTLLTAWLGACTLWAADPSNLTEDHFREKLGGVSAAPSESQQLDYAKQIAASHLLSSLQVKAIASKLKDDAARLEFATAAYPHTVDPENFYEVYDAFTTFSKMMRLHDRVRSLERPSQVQTVVVPESRSEAEFQEILRSLQKESFDQTRMKVAKQILASSTRRFRSEQIKRMLGCFDFEQNKLELAKYAYDYTLDPEMYFLVNDAFDFVNTKETLARYIESRTQPPAAKRPGKSN
jgi:hypothetical protein